jgi:hypothetical protein
MNSFKPTEMSGLTTTQMIFPTTLRQGAAVQPG